MTTATAADRPRPGTNGGEHAGIDAVMRRFFAAFVSGPECVPLLAALHEDFLPAAIVVRTCGGTPTVYDVDGFIAPRRELLVSGALVGFREWELTGRTDVYGDIAQHWCTYAKEWSQDGVEHTDRGTKTVQFVRVEGSWRISAVAWDDQR